MIVNAITDALFTAVVAIVGDTPATNVVVPLRGAVPVVDGTTFIQFAVVPDVMLLRIKTAPVVEFVHTVGIS